MTTLYQYEPLNEATHEIRLLTLQPGAFNSPVRVTLSYTPFTVPSTTIDTPVFEALSYAWGSPSDPIEIFIGDSGHETLSVTHNLGDALPYLRYEDKPRVLWIDAICVNQLDPVERSQQVKRMADIYSNATQVVVWLGLETAKTYIAIKSFAKVVSRVEVNWPRREMFARSAEYASWATRGVKCPLADSCVDAMVEFLTYSWFGRLWIWQEVHLARSSTMICGHQSVPWQDIRTGVYWLHFRANLGIQHINTLTRAARLCDYGRYNSFTGLIEKTAMSECSDPRDRIFALLSMLDDVDKTLGIEPDYTKTLAEVYTDTARKITCSSEALKVLCSPFKAQGSSVNGLPSWVPDWSNTQVPGNIQHNYASGLSKAAAVFPTPSTLQVKGKVVGSIRHLEFFQPGGAMYTTQFASEVKRVLVKIIPNLTSERHLSSEGRLASLGRTLCANNFSYHSHPPSTILPDFSSSISSLSDILEHEPDAWEDIYYPFLERSQPCCLSRCMFVTHEGDLGLGPATSQPGDLVTTILGCDTAIILRPVKPADRDHSNEYRVVGSAYHDGFMNGEALLGSFPPGVRSVQRWFEDGKFYIPAFIDSGADTLVSEDPRLSNVSLPPGWTRRSHTHDHAYPWFWNTETDELSKGWDPRLTAEAMIDRGIELQEFTLV